MPRRSSARARTRRRAAESRAVPAEERRGPFVDTDPPEVEDARGRKMRRSGPFYEPE